MPWVTGAEMADYFVTGATLEDGQQVMLVLPRRTDGVTIDSPMELMALSGSVTAEVHCRQAALDRKWLLLGPKEHVMAVGTAGNAGGLETSALAVGLASAAVGYLRRECAARNDLAPITERLEHTHRNLTTDLQRLGDTGASAEANTALRARANAFVLRATQSALTASKGAGFLKSHPAQRWARQAMFFLVWSCPRPAAEATLQYLMPTVDYECV
jgi:alkylation response protein AidB-like acyl-CoA dehydrogenase